MGLRRGGCRVRWWFKFDQVGEYLTGKGAQQIFNVANQHLSAFSLWARFILPKSDIALVLFPPHLVTWDT